MIFFKLLVDIFVFLHLLRLLFFSFVIVINRSRLLAPGRSTPAACPDTEPPTRATRRKEKKGTSSASARRAPTRDTLRKEKRKEKGNPCVRNHLAPALLALHGGLLFVRSPCKEPVPTPTSMGSTSPLASPAPSTSARRQLVPIAYPIRLTLQHNVHDSATTPNILLQQ